MMQAPEWDIGKAEKVDHASVRFPQSYPSRLSPAMAAGLGRARDTKGLSKGNQSSPVRLPRPDQHPVSRKFLPVKQKKSELLSDNLFSLGYEPALFDTIKRVPRPTSCHHCGLHGSRRCSQCRQTYYCSVECQRKDWASHSVICKPPHVKYQTGYGSPIEAAEKNASPSVEPAANDSPKNPETERKIFLCDLEKSGIREGTEIQGYVVEFSSPSHFFAHPYNEKSVKSLFRVTAKLQEIYSEPENLKKGYTPAAGEICVAKYSQDQQWYRVLVQSVDATTRTAHVLYIDFGNRELLTLDDLQEMHKELELLPPLAMKCFLAAITAPPSGWTPDCLVEARKLMDQQRVSISIIEAVQEEVPCYGVDICVQASGMHVAKLLVEKGFAFARNGAHKTENPETAPMSVPTVDNSSRKKELSDETPKPLPQIQVLSTTAVSVGDLFSAAITEIQNPGEFYCQQLQNAEELSKLMESINKHCNAVSSAPGFIPAVGQVCGAQCTEDGCWYRARILQQMSQGCEVEYIDFGNVEVLPLCRLRPVLPDMLTLPSQAIKCSLADVKPRFERWTREASATMASLVANKIVTVAVLGKTETSLAVEVMDRLANPEVVLSAHLIEAGVALRIETAGSTHTSDEQSCSSWPERQVGLPVGQAVEVEVCAPLSPGEFYCHVCDDKASKSLNELNVVLGRHCSEHLPRDYKPQKGQLCCAFCSADGNWYRAKVLDVGKTGQVKVCFLDYGNVEEVTVDKLQVLPAKFLELPFQAVKCRLAGVKPVGETWRDEAKQMFQMFVVGIKLQAKAVSTSEDGYSVELVEGESSRLISDILIAQREARSDDIRRDIATAGTILSPAPMASKTNSSPKAVSPEINNNARSGTAMTSDPSGCRELLTAKTVSSKDRAAGTRNSSSDDSPEVCVPRQWRSIGLPLNEPVESRVLSVVSPDLFYAFPKQIRVDIQKLKQVMMDIAKHCTAEESKSSYKPSVGDMCCAKYTDDGYWYRAIVLDTSLSAARVAYADYGNTEDLPFSSLLPIKETFLDPPVQIVKCALADITPLAEQWSPAVTERFRALVLREVITLTARSVNSGIYSVSLEKRRESGVLNVAEKLVSEGLARGSVSAGGHCKGPDVCCCSRELLKRVEKLEETLRLFLNLKHI